MRPEVSAGLRDSGRMDDRLAAKLRTATSECMYQTMMAFQVP